MRTLELAPIFRGSVGFDNLPNLFDSIKLSNKNVSYPPYNIELVEEDRYRITLAVAGFQRDEIEITSEQNNLVISGTKPEKQEKKSYLYQGIAERNFERRFQVADFVKVVGAKLENGILSIELVRELPEAMKPRKITIDSSDSKLIDQ